jgi:hypothetical protein
MSQEHFGRWECLVSDYIYVKKGEKVYPTNVTDRRLYVWIHAGEIGYLKENFRECSDDYDPTQVGDRDDDI